MVMTEPLRSLENWRLQSASAGMLLADCQTQVLPVILNHQLVGHELSKDSSQIGIFGTVVERLKKGAEALSGITLTIDPCC